MNIIQATEVVLTTGASGSGVVANFVAYTVTAILLNGSSSVGSMGLPASNPGFVIGALTVTTIPPNGTQKTPIVIGGTNAASFAVTNGGFVPCNLVVGASSIAAGSYSITLSCT